MDAYEFETYRAAIIRKAGNTPNNNCDNWGIFKKNFSYIDLNNDGKISEKELATAMLIADMNDGAIDGKIRPENCPELKNAPRMGSRENDRLYELEVMKANYPEESN